MDTPSEQAIKNFYATMMKIIERREGIKINYEVVKREPEDGDAMVKFVGKAAEQIKRGEL